MVNSKITLPYLKNYIDIESRKLKIEPGKIKSTYDYFLINSLYTPLFFLGQNGELKNGVVNSFSAEGNHLKLKIDGKIKTQSDRPITAKDVYFSLKRLLVLNSNTHGKLNLFLSCDNKKKLLNINDKCKNLNYKGDIVTLTVTNSSYLKFLIKILASPDYSIIPYDSFDHESEYLEINNFRETSGLYFLSKVEENGESIELKVNKNHFLFQEDSTLEKINIVDSINVNVADKITKGELDIISLFDSQIDPVWLNQLKNEQLNVYQTQAIKLYSLSFLKKSVSKLSISTRLKIAFDVKKALKNKVDLMGRYTKQFFPPFSFGAISDLSDIENFYQKSRSQDVQLKEKSIKVILAPHTYKKFHKELNTIKYLDVVELQVFDKKSVWVEQMKEADLIFLSGDTSFNESISLISYYLNSNYTTMQMTTEQGEEWLKKYMSIESKKDRGEMFKQFHKEFLSKFTLIPLFFTNYVTITRKPIKYKGSNMFATNNLWDFTIE